MSDQLRPAPADGFDYPLAALTRDIREDETMAVPYATIDFAVEALRAHIARACDDEQHDSPEEAIAAYRLMAVTSAALALLLRAREQEERDGERLRWDLRLIRDFVRDPQVLPEIEADRQAGTIDEALAARIAAIVKEIRVYWQRHYDAERRSAARPCRGSRAASAAQPAPTAAGNVGA